MKKITVSTLVLLSLTTACALEKLPGALPAVSSAGSTKSACQGIDLSGDIQMIPLDGKAGLVGALDIKDILGTGTNSLQIEKINERSGKLVVYESVVPTRLGSLLATPGILTLEERDGSCFVRLTESKMANVPNFSEKIIARSVNGDLVLGNEKGEAATVIKRLKDQTDPLPNKLSI